MLLRPSYPALPLLLNTFAVDALGSPLVSTRMLERPVLLISHHTEMHICALQTDGWDASEALEQESIDVGVG
jgi:hypothetical protein